MRFRKVYVEISNMCNLKCSFCPGTKRPGRRMTAEEFEGILPKLRPYTDYLYFHLMGEPLCHPELENFLALAHQAGFQVILTTNGTLIGKVGQVLLKSPGLHKINFSVHAFEANAFHFTLEDYVQSLCDFGKQAGCLTVYRLWNRGGEDRKNEEILSVLHRNYPGDWVQERLGIRLADKTYLEYGDRFQWPELGGSEENAPVFCYGLRDQLGVLCDGTVVPCCLDHEGDIPLGNLFRQDLQEILDSPRAKAIYEGFSGRKAVEPLCKTCGYARKFQQ